MEDQTVVDYDASGEYLTVSDVKYQPWPDSITYASGGFLSNFIVVVGGLHTLNTNARFAGEAGEYSHSFVPMLYGHTGGSGSVVGDKFLI